MSYIRKFFPLVLLPVLFAGCSSITNLTPQQQTLLWGTIQPYVVVGVDFYPMRPTSLMKNRWETLLPVPATTNAVHYKFKFDYQYNSIPERRQDSKLSPEFRLTIMDK